MPFTFTSNMRSHFSSVTSSTRSCHETPAMLPSTSMRPKVSAQAAAAARQSSSDRRSQRCVWIRPPDSAMCEAVSARPSSFTSAANTSAPSEARRIDTACPMPEAAPVMSAALPSNRPMSSRLSAVGTCQWRRLPAVV